MPPNANLNSEHTSHPPPPNHHQNHQNHHQNHQNHQNHHSQEPLHHQNHNRYPYQHSHSHSHSSSSASFKGCCCCLLLLLTFLILLVLAVLLVIFLALKPKKPQFALQQVNVEYVGITSTQENPSASLSLTIKLVFKAVNPNKVGIKYSLMEFHVMYRGVPLGVASVPGFYQPANSVRQISTTVSVDRVNMMQSDAVNLIKDATLNDRVELKVFGDVGAKIKVLDFTSPKVKVSLDCAIVISPHTQTLTYKQCGVDGLNV